MLGLSIEFLHIAIVMATAPISFPVDTILPELLRTFESSSTVVLSAPPGAGKTTRVPIALHKSNILKDKKILMLEPRRLAARRAAEFMASQLGEEVGKTVGYRIRGESRTGKTTKIEVLTEGILTRLLQHQSDVPGVGLIIFDEFHERSIHADLGLAFSLDVQKHLRQDLRILIMSATLDGARLASILGNVPVIESSGKLFPIDTHYARFASEKPIPDRMAETIRRALENNEGDLLAFLPGWREIQRTDQRLYSNKLPDDIIVHTLHGEASPSSQSAALAPAPAGKRKVILSTNVAETSFTIEGVRSVVDSGLVRVARFDPRRGMSGLVTIPVSRASADQRRGRAGRLGAGSCYRIWTEAEHAQLPDYAVPEIKSADLVPLALELAQWGSPNGENLMFIDPPSAANLQQAQTLLRDLDAVDGNGKLTAIGRSMTELPVHPRLAHMILRAKAMGLGNMACSVAALLEERDLFAGQKDVDVDLIARWHDLRNLKGTTQDRINEQARRLQTMLDSKDHKEDDSRLGLLLAFAYPERIAQRKAKVGGTYIMASGKQAILPASSKMARNEFLVVADADIVGDSIRIFLCSSIAKEELNEYFSNKIISDDDVRWDPVQQSVIARRVSRLGTLNLSEHSLPNDDARIPSALIDGIRLIGLQALPWDKDSNSFRERSQWLRSSGKLDSDWPDLSDSGLTASLHAWLLPYLSGIRQRSQLQKIDLVKALKSLFSHEQIRELEHLAPPHLELPSGTIATIDYSSGNQPILAVRLQELFGQVNTPRIGKGDIPVLVHLLSPAKRPVAVTQDLASFWKNVYPEIRNQMRAKYPKHVWPEDPLKADPTNKTRRGTRIGR